MDVLKNLAGPLAGAALLKYPSLCALFVCLILTLAYRPDPTNWRWWLITLLEVTMYLLIYGLLLAMIPSLQITSVRVILRPTASCATENNPRHLLCATNLKNNDQLFYESTKEKCIADGIEASDETATPFYIISAWLPAHNHYRLKKDTPFELTENGADQCRILPRGRCVRVSGPVSVDPLQISIKILHEHDKPTLEVGYINKTDLEEFHIGFYTVSNCRSDIWRWLFNCRVGYVNSYYVILPSYLSESPESTKRQ